MLLTVPQNRISVAVIATGPNSAATQIGDAVLEAFLVDKGLLASRFKPVTPPVKAQPIPYGLASYEGYYSNGGDLRKITFDMLGGTLAEYSLVEAKETLKLSCPR